MIDLDVDLGGLRLHELEEYTYDAKQEIRRLRAVNANLQEVIERAVDDLHAALTASTAPHDRDAIQTPPSTPAPVPP